MAYQAVTLLVYQATVASAACVGLAGDFKQVFYKNGLFLGQVVFFILGGFYLLFSSNLTPRIHDRYVREYLDVAFLDPVPSHRMEDCL